MGIINWSRVKGRRRGRNVREMRGFVPKAESIPYVSKWRSEGVLNVGLSCFLLTSGLNGQLAGVSLFFKSDPSLKELCQARSQTSLWQLTSCFHKGPVSLRTLIGIVWKVLVLNLTSTVSNCTMRQAHNQVSLNPTVLLGVQNTVSIQPPSTLKLCTLWYSWALRHHGPTDFCAHLSDHWRSKVLTTEQGQNTLLVQKRGSAV